MAWGHKFCFIKIIVCFLWKIKDSTHQNMQKAAKDADRKGVRGVAGKHFHSIRFSWRFEDSTFWY